MVAAKPLPPRERSRFLAELAYALGEPDSRRR